MQIKWSAFHATNCQGLSQHCSGIFV